MASVRLGRYEIDEYDLPQVCARCGAKAVAAPKKAFSWHPPWVIVLILVAIPVYIIVAVILTKRMTVPLPFCERHRHYWRNRNLFILGGLLGVVLIGVGGAVIANNLDERGDGNLLGWVCLGGAGLFLLWLIVAAVMGAIGIRTNEITDESISLAGLSAGFVEAVREERRAARREREEDDDRPRPRRRTKEDDGGYFDPDAKRPRREGDEDDR